MMKKITSCPASSIGRPGCPESHLLLALLEYSSSVKISAALTQAAIDQQPEYTYEIYTDQCQAKETVQRERCEKSTMSAKMLKACTSSTLQRAMELVQENGSSSWLLALPLQEYGLTPYIKAFSGMHSPSDTDGHLPTYQPTVPCGVICSMSVEHALSCPKGGLAIARL